MSNNPTDTLKSYRFSMNGKDCSGLVRRLTIHQSLTEPFMKGVFDFTDSMHIISESSANVPFSVAVTTQSGQSLNCNMVVEKYMDTQVSQSSGKYLSGSLRLISPEFGKAIQKRPVGQFNDQPAEKIVEQMVKKELESGKRLTTDKAKNVAGEFLVQKQTPTEVISKATRLNGTGEPYVFFEDKDGFNWRSLKKMSEQGASHTFYTNHAAYTDVSAANDPNIIIDCIFNYGGMGDAALANKQQDTRYSVETQKQEPGTKAPNYSSVASRYVKGVQDTKNNRELANNPEQNDKKRGDDFAKQEQYMSNLSGKMKFMVTLNPNVKPGQTINANIAAGSGMTEGNYKSSHSGKWLVKSVTHVCDFSDGSGAPYGRTIIECVGKLQ